MAITSDAVRKMMREDYLTRGNFTSMCNAVQNRTTRATVAKYANPLCKALKICPSASRALLHDDACLYERMRVFVEKMARLWDNINASTIDIHYLDLIRAYPCKCKSGCDQASSVAQTATDKGTNGGDLAVLPNEIVAYIIGTFVHDVSTMCALRQTCVWLRNLVSEPFIVRPFLHRLGLSGETGEATARQYGTIGLFRLAFQKRVNKLELPVPDGRLYGCLAYTLRQSNKNASFQQALQTDVGWKGAVPPHIPFDLELYPDDSIEFQQLAHTYSSVVNDMRDRRRQGLAGPLAAFFPSFRFEIVGNLRDPTHGLSRIEKMRAHVRIARATIDVFSNAHLFLTMFQSRIAPEFHLYCTADTLGNGVVEIAEQNAIANLPFDANSIIECVFERIEFYLALLRQTMPEAYACGFSFPVDTTKPFPTQRTWNSIRTAEHASETVAKIKTDYDAFAIGIERSLFQSVVMAICRPSLESASTVTDHIIIATSSLPLADKVSMLDAFMREFNHHIGNAATNHIRMHAVICYLIGVHIPVMTWRPTSR